MNENAMHDLGWIASRVGVAGGQVGKFFRNAREGLMEGNVFSHADNRLIWCSKEITHNFSRHEGSLCGHVSRGSWYRASDDQQLSVCNRHLYRAFCDCTGGLQAADGHGQPPFRLKPASLRWLPPRPFCILP